MPTDREKAGLRGLVQRTETKAKSLIHRQVEPFRENQWLDEICVYDEQGKLLEWYSPENRTLEQEEIKHRYIYDADGRLLEKQGYGEDDSAEDITKYFYNNSGKLTESIYTNFQGFSKQHIFYDERGNLKTVNTYDGKDASLYFVQNFNYIYKVNGNKLEEHFFKEEGISPFVERSAFSHKRITTFDEAGNKIKIEKYLYDWLEEVDSYEVETYNERGQKTEYKRFSKGDTLRSHYIYNYDENGNLIDSLFVSKSEVEIYLYEYDEWNNLTKSIEYRNDVFAREEVHTYEYDSQKNWTKHIKVESNEKEVLSTTEFERKTNYF